MQGMSRVRDWCVWWCVHINDIITVQSIAFQDLGPGALES